MAGLDSTFRLHFSSTGELEFENFVSIFDLGKMISKNWFGVLGLVRFGFDGEKIFEIYL